MKKIPLHIQILISLSLGLIFSIISIKLGIFASFTIKYIKPFGIIFLNSLKMIAIPLIIASLVLGITNVQDINKLSRIGGKTIFIYFITAIIAIIIGLIIVNILKPGNIIPKKTRNELMLLYSDKTEKNRFFSKKIQQEGPMQILVNIVPDNLFKALTNNLNLLQIVFLSIIFGVALLKIPIKNRKQIILLLEGINDVNLEIIKFIMKFAPIGVFSLISSLLIEITGKDNPDQIFEILYALLWYSFTVIFGLSIMNFLIYPLILKLFTEVKYFDFINGIKPAQLVAFATSSSSATLPITMESVEKNLKVPEEISSFVLPLGATINMNGTCLYQSIAIVFIAQALDLNLSITAQVMIVINVAVSSIGVAGVPGVSIVTTAMILELIGIPVAGLALILAPDRILDMCRSATNITGDAVAAILVSNSEKNKI